MIKNVSVFLKLYMKYY